MAERDIQSEPPEGQPRFSASWITWRRDRAVDMLPVCVHAFVAESSTEHSTGPCTAPVPLNGVVPTAILPWKLRSGGTCPKTGKASKTAAMVRRSLFFMGLRW